MPARPTRGVQRAAGREVVEEAAHDRLLEPDERVGKLIVAAGPGGIACVRVQLGHVEPGLQQARITQEPADLRDPLLRGRRVTAEPVTQEREPFDPDQIVPQARACHRSRIAHPFPVENKARELVSLPEAAARLG